MIPGTHFVDDVEVVKAAAVTGKYGDQWELAVRVPWQREEYTLKQWCDRTPDDPQTGPMGEHHSLFLVQGQRENTAGDAPWHWNYRMVTLDYDGDESQLVSPPRTGVTYAQTPQNADRATQQGSPVQSPTPDWQRRELSIKWGQAVNLAATMIAAEPNSLTVWSERVHAAAMGIFPLLIQWEKEAVDGYLNTPEEPPLDDVGQLEAELQGAEVPQTPDDLTWDMPSVTQDAQGFVEGMTLEGFKKAVQLAGIKVGQLDKAFPPFEDRTLGERVEAWVLTTGKTYEDAINYLNSFKERV